MTFDQNSTIQRNTEILSSDLDGEKVMMSIQRGEYYGLGKTGSFIWNNLENPIQINDLIARIVATYNVEKEQCFRDILPFLNDLYDKKLLLVL